MSICLRFYLNVYKIINNLVSSISSKVKIKSTVFSIATIFCYFKILEKMLNVITVLDYLLLLYYLFRGLVAVDKTRVWEFVQGFKRVLIT